MKNFCENDYDDLFMEFNKNDGFKILLSLRRDINEYANQMKSLKYCIDMHIDWKKTQSFYTNKTTCPVYWDDCFKIDKSINELDLKNAKKMYSIAELKYNTLVELFYDVTEIHYKDKDKEYLIDKYFK